MKHFRVICFYVFGSTWFWWVLFWKLWLHSGSHQVQIGWWSWGGPFFVFFFLFHFSPRYVFHHNRQKTIFSGLPCTRSSWGQLLRPFLYTSTWHVSNTENETFRRANDRKKTAAIQFFLQIDINVPKGRKLSTSIEKCKPSWQFLWSGSLTKPARSLDAFFCFTLSFF